MSAVVRCIDIVLVRLAFFTVSSAARSPANVDPGNGMEQSKDITEPEDHGNHHDAVQNRFNRALHGNKAIYQPQQDPHHDQNFQKLN
jgi:hypothetical protein